MTDPSAVTQRGRSLAGAWVTLALVPVFFFLGLAAAHLPYLVWPYEEGSGQEPLWFAALTSVIFFAILAVPIAATVVFGRRAVRAGATWGWLPVALAGLVGVYVVAITVVNLVAQMLGIAPGP